MDFHVASVTVKCYHILDRSDDVQIIAITRTVGAALDEAVAARGVAALFQQGEELQATLQSGGMLEWMQSDDNELTWRLCTRMSRVRAHFVDIAYVCVSKAGAFPFPVAYEPS